MPIFKEIFLSELVIVTATIAGTSFVFGYLGGGDVPFTTTNTGAAFILGFRALPLILVISALSYLLITIGSYQQ